MRFKIYEIVPLLLPFLEYFFFSVCEEIVSSFVCPWKVPWCVPRGVCHGVLWVLS